MKYALVNRMGTLNHWLDTGDCDSYSRISSASELCLISILNSFLTSNGLQTCLVSTFGLFPFCLPPEISGLTDSSNKQNAVTKKCKRDLKAKTHCNVSSDVLIDRFNEFKCFWDLWRTSRGVFIWSWRNNTVRFLRILWIYRRSFTPNKSFLELSIEL